MNRTQAIFLMSPHALEFIRENMDRKSGQKSRITIEPHGNGKLSVVVGPTQEMMFLIGATAAHGEDTLYKAEPV